MDGICREHAGRQQGPGFPRPALQLLIMGSPEGGNGTRFVGRTEHIVTGTAPSMTRSSTRSCSCLPEDDREVVRTGQQVDQREKTSVVDAHPERPLLVEVEAHEPRDEVRRLTLAALESRPEVQL